MPQQKVPQVQFQRGTVGPVKSNFLAPPRQAPYNTNSALLTQLAQPSYPPPPTQVFVSLFLYFHSVFRV